MTSITKWAGLFALVTSAAACASSAPDEVVGNTASAVSTAAPAKDATGAAFKHSFANSKFHIGANAGAMTHLGLNKYVGSEGSFATDPRNGSVRAILNGDSPTLLNFKPLTNDPAVHNATTLAYFKGAGLPAAQVGDVQALPSMQGGSDAKGNVDAPKFTGYASIVYRTVSGVRVPDSFAWAIFDANNEVVQESVHWPEIPQAAIAEALAMQKMMASPASAAAFHASLPAEAQAAAAADEGEVTIRHGATDAADPSPFASYDVLVPGRNGERGKTRHFDRSGKEIQHQSTKVTQPYTPKQ